MFIAISILIFGLIIAIHELGHFIAARIFRVGVPEFAIGMGPKLLKKQGKETLYTLRAIPIGGFCALDGDDNEISSDRSLFAKPLWQRVIIFASGSLMNILVGFLLLLAFFSTMTSLPTTTLSGFAEGFPLEGQHGFMVGDSFHRIDGSRVYQNANIGMLLDLAPGDTIDVEVIRDGQRVLLQNLPLRRQLFEGSDTPRFGFYFEVNEHPTFSDRFTYTFHNLLDTMRQLPLTLRMFARGQAGIEDVSSVVGIVYIMNQAGTTAPTADIAFWRMVMLMAIISVSVAMVNMLPIPGLDGGRIFLMLVSWVVARVFRRELSRKVEGYINMAGIALLLGLMIFIIFNDIIQIAGR
ncbi:MAG: site-2 protease family protein [Oscillospiraceae bacterium]|nr:site-2 protease family protein [Oscillospiraceae bacterium]